MKKAITGVRRFVGLDVQAETIAAAIAEKDEAVREVGTIANREESVRKLAKKLTEGGAWVACDEAWGTNYLEWIKGKVSFSRRCQQVTLEDYLNEVEHAGVRIARLEKAIDEAVEQAPESMRDLIQALKALRGVAKVGAVTIVAEVGTLSRFEHPRKLMGYSGAVSSENSGGGKIRRVRGSSRRITIMQAGSHARSANIRVINRRRTPLRPLLGMPHPRRKR
jgi:hypothetical protein